MEIYIRGVDPRLPKREARLKLISQIASVAHHYPLHRSPEQPIINFNVDVQYQFLRGRNELPIAHCYLTFPSIVFGRSFLEHLKNSNTCAAAFGPYLRFFPSTTKVGNTGERTAKVPDPSLVKLLRDSVFKPLKAGRALAAETERTATCMTLSALSFGRINQNQAFSSEYQWDFAPNQTSLLCDPTSAALIITNNAPDSRAQSQTISIRIKDILRIEADSPSIILFLSSSPVLTITYSTAASARSLGQNFSPSAGQQKVRVASFNPEHHRIMPFTGKLIRLTFPSDEHFQIFEQQRTQYRFPKTIPLARQVIDGKIYSSDNLNLWRAYLANVDITVAFLLELLIYNHHLDLSSVLLICGRLVKIKAEEAERALINLIAQLGPHVDQALAISADQQHAAEPGLPNTQTPSLADMLETAIFMPVTRRHALEHALEQNGLFWCRSLTITPTGFILDLPAVEESNSILRCYAQPHCFIRVALRDEDGSIHHAERDINLRGFLKKRYHGFLTGGLNLAGRKFDFLGYSSSALKDHQAWFVCPFVFDNKVINAGVIRNQMGDFSRVDRIPARYMARIAQAFTTTREALTLRKEQLELMPDVTRNGSVFTDGVGTISPALARRVETALSKSWSSRQPKSTDTTTCYQIRLGGYKGMLSVDATLVGEKVRLRPSMDKFDAPDSLTLNIANTFRHPLNAFLNRPLIKILEDLSIAPEVFLKLQRREVSLIEDARKSFGRASKLFDSHGLGEAAGISRLLRRLSTLDHIDVHASGFIEECIDLAAVHCLRDLKYRARIPIPGSHTLVGVADEDEVLEPGQVYACIRSPGKQSTYLSGIVAITRSPCCHPGDVQLATAIGQPPVNARRLAGLTNCVVFSVKGSRSLPSCLSGGDLDGDIYTLITDPELIPPQSKIHTPANYDPQSMVMLDSKCTISDGANFVLEYIASDLVGQIANRYLQIADDSPLGTSDLKCLKLSALHSKAVDYPKTGVPVDFEELPKARMTRPDFMSRTHTSRYQSSNKNNFYKSTKALGQLFRDISVEDIEEGTIRSLAQKRRGDRRGDENSALTAAVESLLAAKLGWETSEDEACTAELSSLALAFGEEYWKICRLNTLGPEMGKGGALSEPEAFVGVIAASIGDKREKRETTARLEAQTTELFGMLRAEMVGKVEEELDDGMSCLELEDLAHNDDKQGAMRVAVVRRAWTAWKLACEKAVMDVNDRRGGQPKWFGIRSFGLIALDLMLGEIMV